MIYAMNLFDIIPGKEAIYKEYAKQTMALMPGIDAELAAAGERPGKAIMGVARSHFIVMRFGSMADFDKLVEEQSTKNLHLLREEATENYIWTLYEEWDMSAWFYSEQVTTQ